MRRHLRPSLHAILGHLCLELTAIWPLAADIPHSSGSGVSI